jgi:t-SNARE complex subunit (syntaxin)
LEESNKTKGDGVYDKPISIRVDRKTKFYLTEANVSRRDILRLGLEQYYNENPKLKMQVKMKFMNHEKDYLQKEIQDNRLEAEKLEKEALKFVFRMDGLKEFLKQYTIENEEEFLRSFFEIKKLAEMKEGLEVVEDRVFAFQSLCCGMDTDLFKKACIELLEKYDI